MSDYLTLPEVLAMHEDQIERNQSAAHEQRRVRADGSGDYGIGV